MEWSRGHVIGRGSSATVSVATSQHTGEIFAVKSAKLSQSEPLQREAKILSSLKSPHVVTYVGHDITGDTNAGELNYNLHIEYVPGGTLNDAVTRRKGLDETTIRRYAKKIVQGLDYLHSLGLVHCDIKGRNILLARDGPKIADFGCAKSASSTAKVSGTPMFMAPEAARGEEQVPASDVWSLGCTVIEMYGLSPWPNCGDHVGVIYRIAFSDELPEFPGFLSSEARDFLGKCLARNPAERWTANELLKHPFLSESECSSSSPTSVLDRPVWSFAGEEASAIGLSCSDRDSNVERVERLAMASGEVAFSTLDGQDWIIIRSSDELMVDYGGSRR